MNTKRINQIKEIWLNREDLKTQIYDINKSIIDDLWVDVIKEYLTKKIIDWNIAFDELDDIRFKLLKLEWIEYSKNIGVYNFLYNFLINSVLLPDYCDNYTNYDIFKEFDDIIDRIKSRVSRTMEIINNRGFFNISVWNHDEIQGELEGVFNNGWYIEYRNFDLGWVFWFIHIWENLENEWKYTFRIPIKIPWWLKQKAWEKELLDKVIDPKDIEEILLDYFDWKNGKRTISKNNNNFKWLNDYYITIKKSLNKDLSYWADDTATYYVIDILNTKLKNISDEKYELNEVISFLEWFFEISNVLINDIANKSWIEHKKKYLNFSTMYVYNEWDWDWDTDWIGKSTLEKFSKMLVEMKKPVTLEDIWWQNEAKEEISKIIKSIKHEKIMKSWGSKTTSWIIFEWPPGTWKTLLAQAIATEVHAQVYNIKLTDIASSAYINEWSKNIKELFKFLRYQASKSDNKVVVILDELDALFKKRDAKDQSWEDVKIVNTFLTEMSWFDDIDNIIFIWTTNYIENLDSAVIRSWRMSTKVKVDNPDFEARKQIFEIHIKKIKHISKKAWEAFDNLNVDELSRYSSWLSWADIEEVIRQVIESKAIEEVDTWNFSKITQEDIFSLIKKIRKESKTTKLPTIGFIQ